MKKITVYRNGVGVQVLAPEDKTMAIDTSLLQHGVLSIGEYGTSGLKIAVFRDWDGVTFDAEDHGYKISEVNPF